MTGEIRVATPNAVPPGLAVRSEFMQRGTPGVTDRKAARVARWCAAGMASPSLTQQPRPPEEVPPVPEPQPERPEEWPLVPEPQPELPQ